MSDAQAQPSARILVVDDDPIVADSLAELLRRHHYAVATANDGSEALIMLRNAEGSPFNLVIADMNMPRVDGMELLKHIRQHHESVVVLMITGFGTIESAVEAVKLGAFDYLTKPIVDEEICTIVDKALRQQLLLAENTTLKQQLARRFGMSSLVGGNYKMQKIFDLIETVAPSRTTVLITGESGTGKSMIAQAIHQRSDRAEGPFVTMACGSIPETLLESELFGHVKGAFTGADRDKPGKLRTAEGGTLFIDEINSATPTLQLKLLRVLQERQFEPVGSSETVQVDVRFVLAANESLDKMVKENEFREDLYYRINVVNLELPPLRQREGDIPLLVQHFIEKYCRETGKVVTGVSDEVMGALRRYRWPGNVRELENAMERAVVLSSRPRIELEVLPDPIRYQQPDGSPGFVERRRNPWGLSSANWVPQPLRDAIKEPEKHIILAALQANDWNRQKTAEVLDINRTTLYKKIKQYGLEELAAQN
jgi:DNA-binding NtrC family response regulator